MRGLVLSLCLLVVVQGCASGTYSKCPQAARSPFILVSDVDDTVKVTHTRNPLAALKNGLAGELGFAGMPELYRELLSKAADGRLEFVSGAPSLVPVRRKVAKLLDDARYPCYRLALRPSLFQGIGDFKEEYLREAHSTADEGFILIGDDTQSDPKVYADFLKEKGDKVLAVYIHRITGDPKDLQSLPPDSLFVTAYDIALREYKKGRLEEAQAAAVGEAVLHSEGRAFLPKFQKCPDLKEELQTPALSERLAGLQRDIEARIREVCSKREPDQREKQH